MFRHVKVERRVFDWSVKYLDVEAVSSNRLGSEADPVGAVIIVLNTRLYLISILVSDLCRLKCVQTKDPNNITENIYRQ